MNKRNVGKNWNLPAHALINHILAKGVVKMVITTDHVCDAHIVIINNNGIGMGFDELPEDRFQSPAMAYTIQAGYEKMIEGFGGKGYSVRTPDELSASLKQALDDSMPSIINVHIDPQARAKPQKHHWLTA